MTNKVPNIRFKGFTDDWEQRKLLDLLSQPITDGPHETPNLVDKGVPFISVDAIVDNKIDFHRKRGFITEEYDLECRKKYAPQRDDVYLVKSGSTVGKVAIVETDTRFNIWSPLAAMRANRDLLLPKYLYHFLQLKDTQQEVFAKSKGGTQPNLSMRILEKFNVRLPGMDEQKKISDCLDNLDRLITLHQRKCEQTKELKKFMLQKMFPKKGEKNPEIRFPGFTDDWEQRKLGEIAERVQGNDGRMDLPTLTISAANGWMDQKERFSGNIAGKEQKKYTLLHKGELSYNHGNSKLAKYGTVFSLETYEEALVPRVYHSFKVINGSSKFIEYYFATKIPDRELAKLVSSGARMDGLLNINFNEFMGINLTVPNKSEQEKISNYFSNLDHLITLHQRKCEQLKELKKFMLQNMFPKKG